MSLNFASGPGSGFVRSATRRKRLNGEVWGQTLLLKHDIHLNSVSNLNPIPHAKSKAF